MRIPKAPMFGAQQDATAGDVNRSRIVYLSRLDAAGLLGPTFRSPTVQRQRKLQIWLAESGVDMRELGTGPTRTTIAKSDSEVVR